jgi:ASC-1-like (ASCH) protein
MNFEHKMRLNDVPFYGIKSGKQTIEGRLLDNKRSLIKIGDIIRFQRRIFNEDFFDAKVIDISKYSSFKKMFLELGPKPFDISSKSSVEDFVSAYRKFYSEKEENNLGVVGIHIEVLK